MSLREILVIPDPRLKEVAKPVETINEDTKALIKDMFDTMYDAPGIGLAAPQIGVLERIVVIDIQREDDPQTGPIALINPEIVEESEDRVVSEEGCLSIPEIYYDVERAAEVTVRFTDENGETVTRHCTDRLAICVQHEIDHLNGVLYIDHISRLKRDRVIKKFNKLAKRAS